MKLNLSRPQAFSLLSAVLLSVPITGQANRFQEYTEQYANPPDAARPLAASYLGGSGDEYLIAGDFLPDGTLYLAGNAFGPEFDLQGHALPVLGTDQRPPRFEMPMRNDSPRPPKSWEHRDGAAFIVRLAPDYSRITRAVRFPWGAGVLTDLVTDPRGNIYITGLVGGNFNSVGASRRVAHESFEGDGETFIGKLKPDLSGFDWLIRFQDHNQNTPQLRHIGNGIISYVGNNGMHFNADGEISKAAHVGVTTGWQRGVCFITFAQVRGNFDRSRTGWEPWHRPFVHIMNPDQSLRFRFYQWHSRTVGTNWSRLVSDSAMRMAAFDRKGQPVIGGWSDGGNSVWAHVPYDLTRPAGRAIRETTGQSTGLPFSTWGAGVGSFLHLNRLDFETGNPLTYSLFIAYLSSRNAPSSVSGDNLDFSVDNDLFLSGSSAYGLIQTRDHVVNTLDYESDYIGGQFFAVLSENWNNIRYSSAVPGSGQVDLQRHSSNQSGVFRFGSAHVNGKTRVVAVTGAVQHDKFKPVSPVQNSFGGGNLDGLFVVLEMDTLPTAPEVTFEFPTAATRELSTGETDESLEGLYQVAPGMRNSDSILFLRDSTAKKWPLYYRGNPVGDSIVDASGSGSFVLRAEADRVELGEEGLSGKSRRLAGSDGGETPYPTLEIHIELTGNKTAKGTILFQDRRLERNGPVHIRNSRPSGSGINLSGQFQATKGELGISESPADANDVIHIGWWAPGRPAPSGASVNAPAARGSQTAGRPSRARPSGAQQAAPSQQALRTWTSADGRTIDARMLHADANQVTIQRDDGMQFSIPLTSLSQADQDWVRGQR
ncbi:MAG: hypothetical protein JJU05_06400 [Verrucomicrobia bacterium]|nr:hypothetical protein [Verrucomicrobiota bacterium]MCH8525729.1 hypothetical protein [Kiritimatiellia bacterium]